MLKTKEITPARGWGYFFGDLTEKVVALLSISAWSQK
jgi:hypothetical protein